MRCVLVQDDESHWYVIPVAKLGKWLVWRAVAVDDVPEWATRLNGGPSLVEFDSYVIRKG